MHIKSGGNVRSDHIVKQGKVGEVRWRGGRIINLLVVNTEAVNLPNHNLPATTKPDIQLSLRFDKIKTLKWSILKRVTIWDFWKAKNLRMFYKFLQGWELGEDIF